MYLALVVLELRLGLLGLALELLEGVPLLPGLGVGLAELGLRLVQLALQQGGLLAPALLVSTVGLLLGLLLRAQGRHRLRLDLQLHKEQRG